MWSDDNIGHRTMKDSGLDDSDSVYAALARVNGTKLANSATERSSQEEQRLAKQANVFHGWNAEEREHLAKGSLLQILRKRQVARRRKLLQDFSVIGGFDGENLLSTFNDAVAGMVRQIKTSKAAKLAKA